MTERESEPNGKVELSTIDRRRVLQGIGAAGAIGLIGTGTASGRGGPPEDRGNPQEECDCPEGSVSGKYDFVIERDEDDNIVDCYFEHSEGEDLVTITGWDNKEGEECEPITVYYETVEHDDEDLEWVVTKVCSFGGTDNHSIDDDDDDWQDGTYVSDLENPGGQQAAISNITFCVAEKEPEIPVEEFVGYQVDIIHGEPIEQFDPDAGVTYNSENRLLQAYWSGTGFDGNVGIGSNTDEYQHCLDEGLAIHQDITIENGTASAELSLPVGVDPDDCSLDEFGLVSHSAPTDTWDPDTADQQEVYDFDGDPDIREEDGLQIGRFEVDLPPLL